MTEGFLKVHQPCPCGNGSDNTGINGNGSAYCFTCNQYFKDYESACKEGDVAEPVSYSPTNLVETGTFSAIPDRKLSESTCRTYSVTVTENSQGIISHRYPYFNEDNIEVAAKVRYTADKRFLFSGDTASTTLFGRQAFKAGGKYVTITEGELDAMSAHQMFGNRWPVVSLRNGAAGAVKDIKRNLEYIESFETVVLCFDMDKPGKDAARAVAKLLRPGKCRILTLPEGYKDANEMLVANKSQDFVQAFWNAELYTPSGIVNVSQRREDYFNRPVLETIPYPWDGLNDKLYGLRRKELVTITGGTGLGKSSVTRELEYWLLNQTKDPIGILALEEGWERTTDGLVAIEANKRLDIDAIRTATPQEELNGYFSRIFEGENQDRLYVYAHLGIQDIDDIFSKLRYLIIGCGCKWVVVDHLHMLVASHTEGDERRTIDDIMLRLRSLVEETGCGMVLVSHLRRTVNDKGHEQGIEVSLSHLRGSQSIAQLSDTVVALERNQQADDARVANTTVLRVLKSRYTGNTGKACNLYYDPETGRLIEIEDIEDEFAAVEDGWKLDA